MTSLLFLLTGIVIGIVIGVLGMLAFAKRKPVIFEKTEGKLAEVQEIEPVDSRILEVRELLSLVKNNKKIEYYINPKVLKGLKMLSNEPNWEQQIDDETLNILSDINIKRKKFVETQKLNSGTKKGIKIDKENSHVKNKVWEGTEQEYIEASENGLIDEFTTVDIIEDESDYHGSWLVHNDDGSVEEYMD